MSSSSTISGSPGLVLTFSFYSQHQTKKSIACWIFHWYFKPNISSINSIIFQPFPPLTSLIFILFVLSISENDIASYSVKWNLSHRCLFLYTWHLSIPIATLFHGFLLYLPNVKFLLHADGMIVYLECPRQSTEKYSKNKWIQ